MRTTNAWNSLPFSVVTVPSVNSFNKKAVLSQRRPRDVRYISSRCGDGHSKLSKMAAAAILYLFESKIAPLDPPSPNTPPYNQTWSGSDDRLRRYGRLKFFQHGGGRHLGFVRTVNSAVRSAVPENPTIELNIKWIGLPVAEIWPFAYVGVYGTPILGGKGRLDKHWASQELRYDWEAELSDTGQIVSRCWIFNWQVPYCHCL